MNSLLKTNDYIGLVANSNGIDIANKDKIDNLIACLKELGLNPLLSSIFYISSMRKSSEEVNSEKVIRNAACTDLYCRCRRHFFYI